MRNRKASCLPKKNVIPVLETYQSMPEWNISSSLYIDITAFPTPQADILAQKIDIKGYFLEGAIAFKDKNTNQIKLCWNDSLPIIDTNDQKSYEGDLTKSDYYKNYINNIRINGGDVILSLSGPNSQEIETLIPDDDEQVTKIYLAIIRNYQLKYVNFNFQRDFLCNDLAVKCHIKAIAKLIKELPELRIAYSIPVEHLKGFNSCTEYFINTLYDYNIRPSLINIMAMELDWSYCRSKITERIQNTIYAVVLQIKDIYNDLTLKQIYNMIGICTWFGQHWNLEYFTIEDQNQINFYAKMKGIASLSGYYIATKTPDDYCKIIAQYQDDEVSLSGD